MKTPTTADIAAIIMRQMMSWKTANRTEDQCRVEMSRLSMALINAFAADDAALRPSPDNVSAIIIEEMIGWRTTGATDASRRADLDALAERIIRYMMIFHAQPAQLDGLPGGNKVEAADFALGRRSASRRSLMTSTTGIVLPS
ncbi:hypothetical protein P0F65_05215 [Sphingomonas sp. I4]